MTNTITLLKCVNPKNFMEDHLHYGWWSNQRNVERSGKGKKYNKPKFIYRTIK